MILGIGTDIMEIARIERLMDQFGDDFYRRIYTEKEIEQGCLRVGDKKTAFFATRFAAKEAVSKALGTGIGKNADFKDIEIISEESGKPRVKLHGKALKTAKTKSTEFVVDVSLSDSRNYAVAFATFAAEVQKSSGLLSRLRIKKPAS